MTDHPIEGSRADDEAPREAVDAAMLDFERQMMRRGLGVEPVGEPSQVERWARMGRALEALLTDEQGAALLQADGTRAVWQRLERVDSKEGRRRVQEHLRRGPYPRYKAAEKPGMLIRIDEDGTETVGRFVNRRFQASG